MTNTSISGNLVGVGADGTTPVGNGSAGVDYNNGAITLRNWPAGHRHQRQRDRRQLRPGCAPVQRLADHAGAELDLRQRRVARVAAVLRDQRRRRRRRLRWIRAQQSRPELSDRRTHAYIDPFGAFALEYSIDTVDDPATNAYPMQIDIYEGDGAGQGERWLDSFVLVGPESRTTIALQSAATYWSRPATRSC